jgi:hypothetical protein
MKISRKMAHKVEIKIRHGLATGALPIVERSSANGTHARTGPEKAGSAEGEQGK